MEEAALELFKPVIETATIIAAQYCKSCGRSTITPEDMKLGMKFAARRVPGVQNESLFPEIYESDDDEEEDEEEEEEEEEEGEEEGLREGGKKGGIVSRVPPAQIFVRPSQKDLSALVHSHFDRQLGRHGQTSRPYERARIS